MEITEQISFFGLGCGSGIADRLVEDFQNTAFQIAGWFCCRCPPSFSDVLMFSQLLYFCSLATFQTSGNRFGMDCRVKFWFIIICMKSILITVNLKYVS